MRAGETVVPFLSELEHDGAWLLEDLPTGLRGSVSLRVATVADGAVLRDLALASWVSPDYHGLLHLAYLARLRRLLGAVPAEWEPVLLASPDYSGLLPDAYWHTSEGIVPVEVDLGHYSRERLVVKLAHFSRLYERQVWGTRSPGRLRQLAEALGVGVDIYSLEG